MEPELQRQKTEMSQMTNKPTYAKALMTGLPSSRKTKVHLHLHHHHHRYRYRYRYRNDCNFRKPFRSLKEGVLQLHLHLHLHLSFIFTSKLKI